MTATKTTNSYVELRKAMEENASDIENLVFAGGGAKCVCYLGVIKVRAMLRIGLYNIISPSP
jgi:hypothetical protein